MMKMRRWKETLGAALGAAAAIGVLAGCAEAPGRDTEQPFLSRAEMVIARSLGPLGPPPVSPTNRVADDPRAAALGQQFYFDARFSGPLVDPANIDIVEGGNGNIGEVDNLIDGSTQRVSCARCHNPATGFTDQRTVPPEASLGADFGTRHCMTVINSAYFTFDSYNYWDGRKDSLWSQAIGSMENPREMNFSRVGTALLIQAKYLAPYVAIFGPFPDISFLNVFPDFANGAPPHFPGQGKPGDGPAAGGFPSYDGLTTGQKFIVDGILANYGKSIEAYERLIVSRDSAFDRFVAGDNGAISDAAQRGLKLFIGKGFCINCHNTPRFSDGEFHNLGLAQAGLHSNAFDRGREQGIPQLLEDTLNGAGAFSDDRAFGAAKLARIPAEKNTLGAFRTAPLRSIARTAPYMHTGHLRSLWDVLDFYNRGGDNNAFDGKEDVRQGPPLALTETEIDEIIEFLKSLEGAPVPLSVATAPALPP
jgi:cytochrome c peroxidase